MPHSVGYNLGFATSVCVVCAVFVSSSAVALRERQELNAALDKQRNVLVVAGLAGDDERFVERRGGGAVRQHPTDRDRSGDR